MCVGVECGSSSYRLSIYTVPSLQPASANWLSDGGYVCLSPAESAGEWGPSKGPVGCVASSGTNTSCLSQDPTHVRDSGLASQWSPQFRASHGEGRAELRRTRASSKHLHRGLGNSSQPGLQAWASCWTSRLPPVSPVVLSCHRQEGGLYVLSLGLSMSSPFGPTGPL